MTQAEAIHLAEELWGAGNVAVEPCPGFPGEWLIETSDRPHIMDAQGHPTCHRSCIIRAEEITRCHG